jgi:hypothetical protein
MKTSALKISPEMLRLVAEIDEFKGGWRAMTTLAPERLAVLKQVATIESIGSSARLEALPCQLRNRLCSACQNGRRLSALHRARCNTELRLSKRKQGE